MNSTLEELVRCQNLLDCFRIKGLNLSPDYVFRLKVAPDRRIVKHRFRSRWDIGLPATKPLDIVTKGPYCYMVAINIAYGLENLYGDKGSMPMRDS